MARAAAEALRAEWLFTAPNPRVGALALCGGHVIGYGHHAQLGGAHAEETALRDAGAWDDTRNGPIAGLVDEMIVTLEPCSATGASKRRPACVDLLRAAGIRRLVVGAEDPDPRHRGHALRALSAEGIEVMAYPLSQERALAAFTRALAHPERPFVVLKWAASFDGKMAVESGLSQWISGEESRAETHALRALSDAVMIGRGTLLADDPRLDARSQAAESRRQPLRVLLDAPPELSADARVLTTPGPRLWIIAEDGAKPRTAAPEDLECRVPRGADGLLDLSLSLRTLRAEHGVRRLLVEGGARLHGAFLDQRLADCVVRYEAPVLLGGTRSACAGSGFATPADGARLHHEERRALGPDLRRAFLIQP
ncbi:MAG: bifunctional diaminohydroxyphosphoribosylaminopyrimidine deaminase/5-amino-6-(5-phosphoribosylamino)uracil reductase RibD [Planctomycetota bacterium]|nr:bifunctional diaminohydroxyphosphoribosylaminopyrimidine deaminase/5-amino-6-(5-phosphoribosylamino)uracil reductase RibD [Planctomycetota bacterium]